MVKKKVVAKKKATKKTAAKKSSGALADVRIVIARRFAHEDHTHMLTRIKALGAKVVKTVTADVSIVVVPDDAPRGPEVTSAKKLNAKGAQIEVLEAKAFVKRIAPTAEEVLALLRGGSKGIKELTALQSHSWRFPGFPWPSLKKADLRKLSLKGAMMNSFGLKGADLREANLDGSYLGELEDCDLRGAKLDRCSLNEIKNCDLRGASLRDTRPSSITKSDLRDASLVGVNLSYTELSDCNLEGVDLSRAELREVKLPKSNLRGAKLAKVEMKEANLEGANLEGADLSGAQLNKANLSKANLSKANLSKANLGGADLTGAKLDGADFTGANVAGAKIASRGKSKIKGLAEALENAGGEIGPRLRELSTIAKAAERIKTSVVFDMPNKKTASVEIDAKTGTWGRVSVRTQHNNHGEWGYAKTLVEGLQDSANRWGQGTLQLDSITARSSKSPVGGKELKRLVVAAWCEVCGIEPPAEPAPKKKSGKASKAERQRQLVETLLEDLRSGPEGVERWNARSHEAWAKLGKDASFARSELTEAKLDGIRIAGLDFSLSTFNGASMKNAEISDSKLDKASFVGADLTGSSISKTSMTGADLSKATVNEATLRECDLSGDSKLENSSFVGSKLPGVKIVSDTIHGAKFQNVDLSGTDLAGVRMRINPKMFTGTFDGHTRFPPDYKPPKGMVGPRDKKGMPKAAAGVTLSMDDFRSRLKVTVGSSSYNKGKKMLKASRFQLFAEVTDERMIAIVKSQSDPSRLYACILGEKGYSCITHRLNRCGGLYSGPCKHMMVMIMGLAQANAVDPAKVDAWVQYSKKHGATFDKDAAAEVFLKYKGAEAGEIDWPPTETVPEDFYAF